MDKLINNISRTIKKTNTLKNCTDFVRNYKSTDYKKFIEFSDVKYKKNLVFRNDDFEMFVVCWTPFQGTPKHDHSEKGCIFKILEGNIVEYRYNLDNSKIFFQHNVGSTEYIDNKLAYHLMKNESKTNCVSLHVYSPPNYIMNIYK